MQPVQAHGRRPIEQIRVFSGVKPGGKRQSLKQLRTHIAFMRELALKRLNLSPRDHFGSEQQSRKRGLKALLTVELRGN
jgi:hypothetical protein